MHVVHDTTLIKHSDRDHVVTIDTGKVIRSRVATTLLYYRRLLLDCYGLMSVKTRNAMATDAAIAYWIGRDVITGVKVERSYYAASIRKIRNDYLIVATWR